MCPWNFQPQYPGSWSFSQEKVLANSLNTFGDIVFLPGQCKEENWNFYILWFCGCWKSSNVAIAKENICALEIFNPNSHPHPLSAKKSFRKFVIYFWRYKISAGIVWREKLIFLHFLAVGKVVTLLLQNENICDLEIFNHNSRLPLLSAKKSFKNSLNTSGDLAFLLGQCKGKNSYFYIFWMLEKL